MNTTTNFTATSELMLGILDQLSEDHLPKPTPCGDWTVGDLTTHVIANLYFFAGAAGATAQPEAAPVTPANAAEQYRQAVDAILHAYDAPGLLEGNIATPFGTYPGHMVLGVAFADQLTHCWDFAHAMGNTVLVHDDLVADAQTIWEAFIKDDYRDGKMFGPAVPTTADTAPLARLAAFAGRQI